MAIRDLLWACPLCESEGTLHTTRGAETCRNCGTSYRRGRGAEIVARAAGQPDLRLSAAEWLDRLPPLDIERRIREAMSRDGVIQREPGVLRLETGAQPVAFRGTYLNRIERLGPPQAGTLQLEADRISFHLADDSAERDAAATSDHDGSPDRSGPLVTWAFDEIRAVQPSSSTLQIRALGQPLASLTVPHGSIRFWEELLCAALKAHYRDAGRGEILEFQPRIITK
jgi:hypothetical protein